MTLTFRELMISSYDIPKYFYSGGMNGNRSRKGSLSAAVHLVEFGVLCYWGDRHSHTGRKRRKLMDIELMVERWKKAIVGLSTAHDKAEADQYEASIDECLMPCLAAPIKQLRELAQRLIVALRNDPAVPFLVWRSYEVWVDQIKHAPDGDIKILKTELAKEIVEMVEDDAKRDLPAAMVKALQWRSPTQLEEAKEVIKKEKDAGRSVRLKGRESCLFLEAGGTEDEPLVQVQV